MTDGNVFPIRPGADARDDDRPLVTRGPPPGEWCRHSRFRLDTESRRVVCRACGRDVDAFDVLLLLAREPERWIEHRREAERRARAARGSLEELLRLERNAKSRARRRTR